jgi:hypothetical protein
MCKYAQILIAVALSGWLLPARGANIKPDKRRAQVAYQLGVQTAK